MDTGVADIEKLNTYIVAWSFNNPTLMRAAAVGKSEEEATADIIAAYSEAPEFKITDVHLASEEELIEMNVSDKILDDLQKPRVLN